jgi:hypothetical protein
MPQHEGELMADGVHDGVRVEELTRRVFLLTRVQSKDQPGWIMADTTRPRQGGSFGIS